MLAPKIHKYFSNMSESVSTKLLQENFIKKPLLQTTTTKKINNQQQYSAGITT